MLTSPFTQDGVSKSLFYGFFVINGFVVFIKSLLLLFTFIVLCSIRSWLRADKFHSFEYTVLILFAVLGLILLVESSNLLSLYLALELQSLVL